jgi:uncharacterized protein YggU (UPF0235/DUF167 family)
VTGSTSVSIRVTPGASRAGVGGRRGDDLVVRVSERAVDGRATQAALRAVADAFGVRPRQVRLVSGATSRTKVVEIEADPALVAIRCDELLNGR